MQKATIGNPIQRLRQSKRANNATMLAGPIDSLRVWPSWAIEIARPRVKTYRLAIAVV